ncbi:MAG: hypothetical protein DRP15_02420, partial [Candidatus Aenigmatarchaeota archaeon]
KILFPLVMKEMFIPTILGKQLFNPVVSLMFLLSLIFILNKRLRYSVLFLWLWFLPFFVLYLSYFQCPGFPEYPCWGNVVRYIHNLGASYAIASSIPVTWLSEKLRKDHIFVIFAIGVLLTTNISVKGLFIDGRTEEEGIGDLIKAISKIPKECLIITSQYAAPHSDLVEQPRRWIDIDMVFVDGGLLAYDEMRNAQCIYFLKDYRCRGRDEDECCEFFYKNLELEFIFKEGSVEVFKGEPR